MIKIKEPVRSLGSQFWDELPDAIPLNIATDIQTSGGAETASMLFWDDICI